MARPHEDDPKQDWVPISIRINPVLRDKIKKIAHDEERTYSGQVRQILKDYAQMVDDLDEQRGPQ